MTTTPDAPLLSADAARYPDPRASATGPLYGRGVWELGEDGGDGIVVQGHDRRAWAALNRYCRELGADRPDLHPAIGADPVGVRREWVTFRTSCGCTDEEHAAHRAEHDADVRAYLEAREAGRTPGLPHARSCEEVTENDDCSRLPPCEDEVMAWMFDRHDPAAGPVPETAAPILVWD